MFQNVEDAVDSKQSVLIDPGGRLFEAQKNAQAGVVSVA